MRIYYVCVLIGYTRPLKTRQCSVLAIILYLFNYTDIKWFFFYSVELCMLDLYNPFYTRFKIRFHIFFDTDFVINAFRVRRTCVHCANNLLRSGLRFFDFQIY